MQGLGPLGVLGPVWVPLFDDFGFTSDTEGAILICTEDGNSPICCPSAGSYCVDAPKNAQHEFANITTFAGTSNTSSSAMPLFRNVLLATLLYSSLICVSGQLQRILPNDTMPWWPIHGPDSDVQTLCPESKQYGIFTQPTGCFLCQRVPINNVDPKFIKPVRVDGQPNVPGFPEYSTWGQSSLWDMWLADIDALGLFRGDPMFWPGSNNLPPSMAAKWEHRPRIPCACVGEMQFFKYEKGKGVNRNFCE